MEMSTMSMAWNTASLSTSSSRTLSYRASRKRSRRSHIQIVRAVNKAPEECNEEECAPPKEVGSLSMEWKAEEKTKIIGTFPPMTKQNRITGYVEKDSAGQTNIYAVEPPVYLAESAISTGSAGASSEGSQTTIAIVAGLGLATVAAAGLILSQESAPNPVAESDVYSGPPLSYYMNKFETKVVLSEAPAPGPGEQIQAPEF